MSRLTIAVIFGGVSEEHPVSVKSAREVARNLNLAKYEPLFIGITKAGEWRLLSDSPAQDWEHVDHRRLVLSPDTSVHGILVERDGLWETVRVDVAVPVLHGRHGEDGVIQGLLELSGIPYVGCGVASSALAMDKSLTYLIVRNAGIATPDFWTVTGNGPADAARVSYPVFVKPARSGSSFGVSRVDRQEDLPDAVDAARYYDSKVLIERAVVGTEVGCAVLEDESGLVVGEVDQIRLSHGFFRIHQEEAPEVHSENATILVPAEISEAERDRVQQTARTVFRALGCRGLARIDLFLTAEGEVVLNEVNTFPGMTSYSRYPRMMAATGITLSEVIDRLIAFALKERQ
ncbi:D-alanine--D-alanine ligase family protein [Humibacter ginsengisoli]